MTVRAARNNNDPPETDAPPETGLEFQITDTKLYIPALTFQKKMTKNFWNN